MAEDWTRAEVEAAIADRFDMLEQELRVAAYNKTEHRRRLFAFLNHRSDGAIERKHQNISVVLIDLGFVYIPGYKPLRNYQRLLFEAVEERLRSRQDLVALVSKQVAEPATTPSVENLLSVLVAPPKPDRAAGPYVAKRVREGPLSPPGVDYLAIESRSRSLGAAGEEFVVRFETARLFLARKNRLAEQVEYVSETRGDGLGFDMFYFETSAEERLIEVKTTAYGPSTRFFVTRNEVNVSRETGEKYHLYRAFNFRREPKLFTKRGRIEESFDLQPAQFVASAK